MPKGSYEQNRGYVLRSRQFIRQAKMWSPCVDCGGTFPPEAMDFDHISGDKEYCVGNMASGSWSIVRLQSEIAKCELVCSNCHRSRTAYRKAELAERA